MKRISLFCLIGAIGLLFSCTSDTITIKGKVKNAGGETVLYNRTIQGVYSMIPDTLHLQKDSSFIINVSSSEGERFSFFGLSMGQLGSFFSRPGTTEVEIDLLADDADTRLLVLDGKNRETELLLEVEQDRQKKKWKIAKDTNPASVCQKIVTLAKLYDKKLVDVDDVFRQKARQNIRMQLLFAFEQKFKEEYYRVYGQTKQEWINTFLKVIEFVELNNPNNVFSPVFTEVIQNVAEIQSFEIQKSAANTQSQDKKNEVLFGWYEKELQGLVREVALAQIILQDYKTEAYEESIEALYDRFLKLYPESLLKPFLEEAVAKNKFFNETVMSSNVHILDSEEIQSLNDLLSRYRGKVVYVDIWATWCWSCRKAFEHIAPLLQYAKERDIILLFISVDDLSKRSKWIKMANFYNLQGEHVIVNEAYESDLNEKFGTSGHLFLPHSAIINKKGEIQFRKAAGLEQFDKLKEQLEEALH